MRRVILMLALAVVSSSAISADWVAVGGTNSAVVYVNPNLIHIAGNMVKVWSIYDFETAQVIQRTKPYMSIQRQVEFDCKQELRSRDLYVSFHTGKMGTGGTIFSEIPPLKWAPFAPKSTDERLWKMACGKM